MSNAYLTLIPIIFPILTGFALFSRPIFGDVANEFSDDAL